MYARTCCALCVMAVTTTAHAAEIIGLGDLPGGRFDSMAFQISGNGKVVVGYSSSALSGSRKEAFYWTRETGMVAMGDLPGGKFSSAAIGVSYDGSVIVGEGSIFVDGLDSDEAFTWTAATGMVGRGDLPGGRFGSHFQNVSADGRVAVGLGAIANGGFEATRWSTDTGMVGLGHLPGSNGKSQAMAVSADGRVVVGHSIRQVDGDSDAFVWTEETGMIYLGDFPGGRTDSVAEAISPDGRVVLGQSQRGIGNISTGEAFRWTVEEGLVGLGFLPGCNLSSATAASWDGSVIVGRSCGDAFIWTEETGMRSLKSVLTGLGVDITGWNPYEVRDISWDGRVLTGWGNTPRTSDSEAWVAILRDPDPVPGDTNGDGDIDIVDLNNVRNHFGESEGPIAGDAYPFDGVVDIGDLNLVRNNFGGVIPFPVPEPSSLILAVTAILLIAGRCLWQPRRSR